MLMEWGIRRDRQASAGRQQQCGQGCHMVWGRSGAHAAARTRIEDERRVHGTQAKMGTRVRCTLQPWGWLQCMWDVCVCVLRAEVSMCTCMAGAQGLVHPCAHPQRANTRTHARTITHILVCNPPYFRTQQTQTHQSTHALSALAQTRTRTSTQI